MKTLLFFEFLNRCGAQDEFNHVFLVEIFGFCLVGNHFQILGRVIPEYKFSDEDILKHGMDFYGDERIIADESGQLSFH